MFSKKTEKIKQYFSPKVIHLIALAYGILLVVFQLSRIFDNAFWADEVYSIDLGRMPLAELMNATAHDVHPPLYYMILKLFIVILGDHGWVYHLVSVVPFAILIGVTLTLVWDEFGAWTSILFMSFSSLLYQAVHFIVEIRMYEWAALLLTMAYLYLNKILKYKDKKSELNKNCILFTLFSLLAAFTHYYCLIALVAIYVGLMIVSISDKGLLQRTLVIWIVTFLAYLPWCVVFFMTLTSNAEKIFSTGAVSVLSCFQYIFDSRFSWGYLFLLIATAIVIFAAGKELAYKQWMMIGLITICFTIAVPAIITVVAAPMLFIRNLYPVCMIAWLLLAANLTRMKWPNVVCMAVAVILIPLGMKDAVSAIREEQRIAVKSDQFVEQFNQAASGEDVIIVSNEDLISPGLAGLYFPTTSNFLYLNDEDMETLVDQNAADSIMVIDAVEFPDSEEMKQCLYDMGYDCETVVEDGFWGNFRVDLIRFCKSE